MKAPLRKAEEKKDHAKPVFNYEKGVKSAHESKVLPKKATEETKASTFKLLVKPCPKK